MVDGMNAAAVERGGMQVDALPWCEHPMRGHATQGLVKG